MHSTRCDVQIHSTTVAFSTQSMLRRCCMGDSCHSDASHYDANHNAIQAAMILQLAPLRAHQLGTPMHPQSPHRRPQAQPTLRRTPTRADHLRTTHSTAPHRRCSRPLFCRTIGTRHTCAAIAARGSHHSLHRRSAGPSAPIILRSHPRLQHSVNGDHFRLQHSVNAA